jgi:putative transposase
MPRTARHFIDGLPYHVLNRGNRRQTVFAKPVDYEMFLTTLADALEHVPIGILSFAIMPNHFHLVLLPNEGSEISAFMRWLMNAHIRRHHRFNELWGTGHLYQGRFKAFPIQLDHHLLTVLRYVEANPHTARLVPQAELWSWSTLSRRTSEDGRQLVAASPIERPENWRQIVNQRLSPEVRDALRTCARRQVAYGDPEWIRKISGEQEARQPESAAADPEPTNPRGHSTLSVPGDCPG